MPSKQEQPEYNDWIRFSTKASDVVVVKWSDEELEEGLYYKIKARWGKSVSELDAIHKEVDIWVALEYMGSGYKDQNPESVLRFPSLSGDAVTEQLNERFFYGQNRKERKRFIVYHPPLRQPFQARFRVAPVIYCIGQAADLIPTVKDIDIKGKKTVKKITALLITVFGDHLRQFAPLKGPKSSGQAQQISIEVSDGDVKVNKDMVDVDVDMSGTDEGVTGLLLPELKTREEMMKK